MGSASGHAEPSDPGVPDGVRGAPPAGPTDAEIAGAYAAYGGSVHARIVAHVRYPEDAARAGIQGTVDVRLVLGQSGELLAIDLPPGIDARLARAALEAVTQAAPFGPPPRALVSRQPTVAFDLPVRFVLRR